MQALQSVAFKDKSDIITRNSVIEEDNDLYCTSYSDGIFNVKLLASDVAHLKCKLEAKSYILHLTATEIQLKNIDNGSIVAKWPYRYVRKYGYRDGKFTFEAGRKCDTGEGEFSLHHANPQEVFRCMAAKMKSMKKLISGESMASLDCGEHQFNAALSMEAGSRSPLPPSPNQPITVENDLNQSGHLLRGFLSSNDSLNNVSISSSSTTASILKNIPNKPPRKSVTSIDNNNDNNKLIRNDEMNIRPTMVGKTPAQQLKFLKQSSYEPVTLLKSTHLGPSSSLPTSPVSNIPGGPSKSLLMAAINDASDQPPKLPQRNESMSGLDERNYERIETITNAWKTMGVDDVKHTEHVTTPEDELAEFVWQRSQSQKESDGGRIKKPLQQLDEKSIATLKCETDDNYDKLQFFATKGNVGSSSDYKTIVMINSPGYRKQTSQPITSNDYEIIGECGTGTSVATSPATSPPSIPPLLSSDIHQTYRLADDSYMGYGVLRKPAITTTTTVTSVSPKSGQMQTTASTVSGNNEELLDHRKYNGLDYAIVSKPKRV